MRVLWIHIGLKARLNTRFMVPMGTAGDLWGGQKIEKFDPKNNRHKSGWPTFGTPREPFFASKFPRNHGH